MTDKLTKAGLNLIQQALSIFDSDLRLAVCNRRYQELFDLPEELVSPGASFEATIRHMVARGEYGAVDDPDEAVRHRVEVARAFEPHYMERTRANGRTISVEGAPLPQGGWVTVYTDITEIKYQERLLRARSEELSDQVLAHAERLGRANRALAATISSLEEAKRELTEMEARTRLTTEMMPAHIAHVDRDLRYTYSNRRLSSVFPGRPRDIVGKPVAEVLGPQAFDKLRGHVARALGGEPGVLEFTDEPSGRRIRTALNPDRAGETGPINGVYVLSMDVTEEAQARAALAQSRKRALTAQLTSGMAHDFANLLTVILGLQARLSKLDLPAGAGDLVAATQAAARRGGVLLERIAGMSGRRELHPVATDLAVFCDDLRRLVAPTLPAPIRLDVVMEPGLGLQRLDPGGLQDALVNLVLNARDAIAPAAEGAITLSLRRRRDTWLEITVEDDGSGFSERALAAGLAPFFTTKGSAGSGLGLPMVYDFAQLSGGTLRLANRPEGGARVTLRLPLRPVEAVPGAAMVLLVEDTEEIRVSVREMLRGLGHPVVEAGSAEEALELAALPEIGIVLSDVGLPGGCDGIDLIARLESGGSRARHYLMTSRPDVQALMRGGGEGGGPAVPVIAKPFTEAELAAFLSSGGRA